VSTRVNPVMRRGSTADKPYGLVVTPENAGWDYSGLRVLELAAGETATITTGPDEMLVLPLSGGCRVTCGSRELTVTGRRSVFTRVTDFAYVPRDATVSVSSADGGRFALPSARAERRLPFRYGPAEGVGVELRGAGRASRQVNNFCTPETFDADRLIACEVLTPGGNWSSYPPHKHDEDKTDAGTGRESRLEEIYYFEVADSPDGRPGSAYQRVSGHDDRPIEVCAEVRGGDVVLIPYGWHGPSMAAPGYDLYYLNVMAGPGERAWHVCDHPDFAWVRSSWRDEPVDARLPLTGAEERKES
jgi:5-deoxy-glucuronate isomerase